MQRDPEELALLCELLVLGIEAMDRLGIPGGSEGPAAPVYKGMQAAHDLIRSGDDPDSWLAAVDARHDLRRMLGGSADASSEMHEAADPACSREDPGRALRVAGEQLNALASRMVGVDPKDRDALSAIREQALKMENEPGFDPEIRAGLASAMEPIERLTAGECGDPQAEFDLAVSRLDEVSDHLRESTVALQMKARGRDGQTQPDAGQPAASQASSPAPQPQPADVPGQTPDAAGATPGTTAGGASAPAVASGGTSGEEYLPADFDRELMGEFVTECRDLIESAEGALLELEADSENMEAINTVFRAFHTIKGTSGFLGVTLMGGLAHRAENLLTRVRDKEILCTGGYADLCLRSCDMLKFLVDDIHGAMDGAPLSRPDGYDEFLEVLGNPEAAGVSGDSSEGDCLDLRVGDLLVGCSKAEREKVEQVAASQAGGKIGQALLKEKVASAGDVSKALRTQKRIQGKSDAGADASVRVRTERLDRLIDMVGELVIAQSMVAQDGTVVRENRHDLQRKVTHAGKIVRELQGLTMSMRMVPLKPTFQKMTRLVRDLAQKSGKHVEFVTKGEDTEIDRNMVDVIGDPLVHMIRNAADHGIESPEARAAAGKPPAGRVVLSAYHAGGNVVVELTDDGKGLDREKIAAKAIERGLIETDKGMTDTEVFNLIFEAGFSTAEKVTEVSGRGVGMDVVRRAIQSLRGRVEISSELGKGTVFTVKLPLTLAITDGMLIRVGSQRFILPTISIHMSFRPEQSVISTITGRGEMVMLQGSLVPIVRLHRLFMLEGAIEKPTDALLVVIDDGDRRLALQVDELLGQQQVVAKSLGEGVGKVMGVSGGAILGDGRVGMILDPGGISALSRGGLTPVNHAALAEMMAA